MFVLLLGERRRRTIVLGLHSKILFLTKKSSKNQDVDFSSIHFSLAKVFSSFLCILVMNFGGVCTVVR